MEQVKPPRPLPPAIAAQLTDDQRKVIEVASQMFAKLMIDSCMDELMNIPFHDGGFVRRRWVQPGENLQQVSKECPLYRPLLHDGVLGPEWLMMESNDGVTYHRLMNDE